MMEMLKKANVALILVAAIAVKAVVLDVSVAAMLVIVPILAFEAYKLYLQHKAPEPVKINEEVQKDLDSIKSKLNLLHVEKSFKTPTGRYF
jgi:hypothetical protein